MARTRGAIKTLVESHTGRTKDVLENSLCDSALKLAVLKHPFKQAILHLADFTLTEDLWQVDISTLTTDQNSVDISSYTPLGIVTARIVEASGSRNMPLIIKGQTWWDKHIINPEDNTKGWPVYGIYVGDYIYFDRPLQSGLELRLRVTVEQAFTDDDTVCPIACLDLFVEKFVTAEVFLDVGNHERFIFWKAQALGPRYEVGDIGGALEDAIQHDLFEIAEELKMARGNGVGGNLGLSILNLTDWHDRYNEVDMWY